MQRVLFYSRKLHLLIYNKEGKIIYRTQSKCSKCKIKNEEEFKRNDLLIFHRMVCPKCKTRNELTVSVDLLWKMIKSQMHLEIF